MQYFRYGTKEMTYLSARDKRFGRLIKKYGRIRRPVNPDLFQALLFAMVSQQISVKAASTVYQRLTSRCTSLSPEGVGCLSEEVIQKCGMSMRKAQNILSVARVFASGRLDPEMLKKKSDRAVTEALTALPGVGVWTAEMILMHSLQRPDVFSYDDLVIRKSLMSLHAVPQMTRRDFVNYKTLYSPYGSVAMIYLWRYGKEF